MDSNENEVYRQVFKKDASERLAGLRIASLFVYLGSPYQQGSGQLSAAWDRLRQICIDYQVVPPTASELIKLNSNLVWPSDDGGIEYNALKEQLGFMGERIQHILKMPDGRFVDLAAGCFIN